jgi:hypothetical protein
MRKLRQLVAARQVPTAFMPASNLRKITWIIKLGVKHVGLQYLQIKSTYVKDITSTCGMDFWSHGENLQWHVEIMIDKTVAGQAVLG